MCKRDKRYWIMVCAFAGDRFGCSTRALRPRTRWASLSRLFRRTRTGLRTHCRAPAAPASTSGPKAKFSRIQDIPIPPEIDVQSKNSYVFQSGQMKMGFLTLRGRVDSNSVLNFFVAALPREGWRLKGQFRYNRSLLIFDKPDKVCVILMKEETYYTYVEIYVSPVAGS